MVGGHSCLCSLLDYHQTTFSKTVYASLAVYWVVKVHWLVEETEQKRRKGDKGRSQEESSNSLIGRFSPFSSFQTDTDRSTPMDKQMKNIKQTQNF